MKCVEHFPAGVKEDLIFIAEIVAGKPPLVIYSVL